MKPKVSVIIPAYNAENTLKRTVESICVQTLKNIEIIIVNDGSKDSTQLIADQIAYEDKRVKVVNQENGGCYRARLSGLKVANGEYVGFVDSDDSVEPDMYEILYNAAMTNQLDVVECEIYKEKNNVKDLSVAVYKDVHSEYVDPVLIGCGRSAYVWDKIYRNQYDFSEWIDGNFGSYEDLIHNLQFFRIVKRFGHIRCGLYHYAPTDMSVTRTFNNKMLDVLDATYVAKSELIKELGVKNIEEKMEKWMSNELKNLFLKALLAVDSYSNRVKSLVHIRKHNGFKCFLLRFIPVRVLIFLSITTSKFFKH